MNENASDAESAFSSQNVLGRLATARGQVSKEANRLFLASLVFAGLYLIRASGLRVDLTLLDTDVANVPHGLFFFLVASQVSMILCYMRMADAAALDHRIKTAIKKFGHPEEAAQTFIDHYEWSSAADTEFRKTVKRGFPRLIYNLTSIFTLPTWLGFYLLPIGCGIYAIVDWQDQIATGDISLQFWTLVVTTALTMLWFVNFVVLYVSFPSR